MCVRVVPLPGVNLGTVLGLVLRIYLSLISCKFVSFEFVSRVKTSLAVLGAMAWGRTRPARIWACLSVLCGVYIRGSHVDHLVFVSLVLAQ